MIERLPPQNIEAEEAVLGALLIDPDATLRIAPLLRPEDFYREKHGWIYAVILALHERREAVDFLTVCDELERREQLHEVGGAAFITSLINAVPTSIHVEHYARIVERTATRRRLLAAASQIAALAYQEADDVDQVLDRAEQIALNVRGQRRNGQRIASMKELVSAYYDRLEALAQRNQPPGLPTSLADLDKLLGGLQRSDLILLAARPSMGKTSLATSIVHRAAERFGARVLVFGLEESGETFTGRLVSMEAGIDNQRLRKAQLSDEEWSRFARAASCLADLPLFVDDTPGISAQELRARARRLHAEAGLDLVVVDYLQLMYAGYRTENRVQEVSAISQALKNLARELDVPLLALSQLSRAVEQRLDKRPLLSDLRDSGSLEQDADVVIFVYREERYKEDTERRNIADLIVAKHRHGPTGQVSVYFEKELGTFRDLRLQKLTLNGQETMR